jgi:hypothetical protein
MWVSCIGYEHMGRNDAVRGECPDDRVVCTAGLGLIVDNTFTLRAASVTPHHSEVHSRLVEEDETLDGDLWLHLLKSSSCCDNAFTLRLGGF